MKHFVSLMAIMLLLALALRHNLNEGPIAVPVMIIPSETSVGAVAWSPDGQFIAYSDLRNDTVTVWDIQKEEAIYTFQGEVYSVVALDWNDDGPYIEDIRIQDLDWNPEFDVIAYVDDTRTVSLWDLDFDKIIFRTTSPWGPGRQANYAIGPVEWSDDGQLLATVDGTGNIVIWKVYL